MILYTSNMGQCDFLQLSANLILINYVLRLFDQSLFSYLECGCRSIVLRVVLSVFSFLMVQFSVIYLTCTWTGRVVGALVYEAGFAGSILY